MNEKLFGYRIKQSLNRGLDFDAKTLASLKSMRFQALEKHDTANRLWVLSPAGRITGQVWGPWDIAKQFFLPILILVVGLTAVNHWYQTQIQQEIVEIDAQVLTGDLPLDAYLDRGFAAWLKQSSE